MSIKVWPKDEFVRKNIRHPAAGAFSLDPAADPAEWPDDQFTTRRLADGDITTSAPAAPKAAKAEKSEK